MNGLGFNWISGFGPRPLRLWLVTVNPLDLTDVLLTCVSTVLCRVVKPVVRVYVFMSAVCASRDGMTLQTTTLATLGSVLGTHEPYTALLTPEYTYQPV